MIHICRLVEGLPLGILLAAAWVEMLSPREIATEISQGLDLLESDPRDVPERQRSIHAVFGHSRNLLTAHEHAVTQALSVFRGGFTREAAQQVTGASLRELMGLVNKSLLHRASALSTAPGTGGRYEMHELLRQYAAEKLPAQPEVEARARNLHCTHYTTFLEAQEKDPDGERVSEALTMIKQEIENVRTAWRWAVAQARTDEIERGLSGLSHFYTLAGPFQEAEKLFEMAADRLRTIAETKDLQQDEQVLLGKLLMAQARFQNGQGKYNQASALAQSAIDLAHRCQTPGLEAEGHLQRGEALFRQRECDAAQSSLERSIALARSAS